MRNAKILSIVIASFTLVAHQAQAVSLEDVRVTPALEDMKLAATLTPLNMQFTPTQNQRGEAKVTIRNNRITVDLTAMGLEPGMMHMAHIHRGSKCPDSSADLNKDGVIDVIEGVPAYGAVLVNFGSDLSSLAKSKKGSPMADKNGTINFRGVGNYTSLVNDLHVRPALAPATGIGKLKASEVFQPEMGVIVVHGVNPNAALPMAAGLMGATPQASLPVLCGRLQPAE